MKLMATERLHNKQVEYIKSMGARFTRNAATTVRNKNVKILQGALWYIHTAHLLFEERVIHLLQWFVPFQGFNNYSNWKTKPRISADELSMHSAALAGLLMRSSLCATNFKDR